MTEAELRKECGLKSDECINSNLGALDILCVDNKDIVTLGVVATGRIIEEPVQMVISKMKNRKK